MPATRIDESNKALIFISTLRPGTGPGLRTSSLYSEAFRVTLNRLSPYRVRCRFLTISFPWNFCFRNKVCQRHHFLPFPRDLGREVEDFHPLGAPLTGRILTCRHLNLLAGTQAIKVTFVPLTVRHLISEYDHRMRYLHA